MIHDGRVLDRVMFHRSMISVHGHRNDDEARENCSERDSQAYRRIHGSMRLRRWLGQLDAI